MLDCVWYAIGACDAEKCAGCTKRLSHNSDFGQEICETYSAQVELALEPVRAEWRKKFEEGSLEQKNNS